MTTFAERAERVTPALSLVCAAAFMAVALLEGSIQMLVYGILMGAQASSLAHLWRGQRLHPVAVQALLAWCGISGALCVLGLLATPNYISHHGFEMWHTDGTMMLFGESFRPSMPPVYLRQLATAATLAFLQPLSYRAISHRSLVQQ